MNFLRAAAFLLAAGLTPTLFALMGCSAKSTLETTRPVASLPANQVCGGVHVWSWSIAAKSLQDLTPAFERAHPRERVTVDQTGAGMMMRLMLSLASGTGAPDVTQMQAQDTPRFIGTGQLADLTPVAAKYQKASSIVGMLLRQGADVNARTSQGVTAMSYAGSHKAVLALLLPRIAARSKPSAPPVPDLPSNLLIPMATPGTGPSLPPVMPMPTTAHLPTGVLVPGAVASPRAAGQP